MNPRNLCEYWDQQASIYASEEGHRQFDRYLALFEEGCWRYIEPRLPKVEPGAILEAGCGTGRWVLRLAPMGHKLALADLSPEMIVRAREKIERLGLSDCVTGYHTLDICDLHALKDASFDLVLALGGPLSLCRDASLAIREFWRVTRPGGYLVCDAANRFRTALELARENRGDQLASVLDTGRFSRRDGLVDQRFAPQELEDLFAANGWELVHLAGICPFFEFLPSSEQVSILEDEQLFDAIRDAGLRYAEEPSMVSLSGRLLVVGQRA